MPQRALSFRREERKLPGIKFPKHFKLRSFARKIRGLRMTLFRGWLSRAKLLHEQEGAEGEGVDSGAVETADGSAGIGDKRLAKEIERGVDENGGWSGFAEFVQEFPEKRIGSLIDGMNAHLFSVKGESFEAGNGFSERGKRRHRQAIG